MAVEFTSEHGRTNEYLFFPEDITIIAELNGRFDKPDIEWLINDILLRGQSTPIIIRNDGGKAVLVAGFSRWRAIGEINKRGLGIKRKLRCTYARCNEEEAFLINIAENRFRNPTTAIDDAHNIKRLLNIYGKSEEEIAGIYFPTAKTKSELSEATKFVRDRIALISLSPEAEQAVVSGKVKGNAAVAIAKLSQEQQKEVLKKEGTIERKDVVPAKTAKPVTHDTELRRRLANMFEDIESLLMSDLLRDEQYIEVERKLLIELWEYYKQTKVA